ncbi:MAG TPA: PASTA domain-containing protein [Cyclobacteriaceae bacterium]|nr:PASTA domain-containing protein [Cyclobacteriaceae bacterium]
MKILGFLRKKTLGAVLANLAIAFFLLTLIGICYFFIYLPNATNHGDSITVPDLAGMKYDELEVFLTKYELRFEVEDSVYHGEYPPLTVLRQFPKAGATVKQNRIIYVSINPVMPPMVPMPDLANPNNTTSRIGAEAILKSNGLKRGRIIQRPHIDLNLVLEMRYQGKKIEAGTRIPKGSVIDLVVGDGNGPSDFVLGSLTRNRYNLALYKLQGWDLRQGQTFIPDGVDTTGKVCVVYRQYPPAGDSVRVGDQIDLYIAPMAIADSLLMVEMEADSVDNQ